MLSFSRLIVSFDIVSLAILTSTESNGVPRYFYGAFLLPCGNRNTEQ
jgi:hypothetical protein